MNNKKTSDTLKFLMNFDLVVCSYCYKIVPNGNYCERCGKKLIPVQELDDSLRAHINKDLSTKFKNGFPDGFPFNS
jgi:rRNA maturation endonuclease Nob1